jgi:hypothetical protein
MYDIILILVWHQSVILQMYDITVWPWYHTLIMMSHVISCIMLSIYQVMYSIITCDVVCDITVWYHKCVMSYKNGVTSHVKSYVISHSCHSSGPCLCRVADCYFRLQFCNLSTGCWLQWGYVYSQGRPRCAQGGGAQKQCKRGSVGPGALQFAALRPGGGGGAEEEWPRSPLFYIGHYASIHLRNSTHSVLKIQSYSNIRGHASVWSGR